MRQRTLPIALIIAASLTPVAGCSDNDASADNQNQGADRAVGHSGDTSGDASHHRTSDESPIPVHDPNTADNSASVSAQSEPAPPAPDRIKQLAQQINAIKQRDQKRLDAQAQRIDTLEQQVAALTKRLRRLPQPATSNKTANAQHAKADKTAAPDAVSPQSDNNDATDDAAARKAPDSGTAHDDTSGETADDSGTGAPSEDSPPAAAQVSGENIVTHCSDHGEAGTQFDVFFQAADDDALDAAADRVRSAGISDWFARARINRLFVGRYGPCSRAESRRADVHQRTGLALNIRAVVPPHASASRKATQRTTHDYGAADNAVASIRQAATQPIRPATTNAPFTIIGVEIRGTHHYLGVAAHNAARLGSVTWLSPGDSYGTWTLRAIRTDAGTANFAHDGRTVAVALPQRG